MSGEVSKPTELVIDNWSVVKEVLAFGDEASESFEKFLAGLTGLDELVGYFDAFLEYINSIAADAQNANPNVNRRDLLELLNQSQHELLPRRVYAMLETAGGEVSDEFFVLVGETLSGWQPLVNEPRFIDRVCRPILENGNQKGVEWLSNVAQASPELFTQNDDTAAANDFMDRVRQRLADTPEDDERVPDLNWSLRKI